MKLRKLICTGISSFSVLILWHPSLYTYTNRYFKDHQRNYYIMSGSDDEVSLFFNEGK